MKRNQRHGTAFVKILPCLHLSSAIFLLRSLRRPAERESYLLRSLAAYMAASATFSSLSFVAPSSG